MVPIIQLANVERTAKYPDTVLHTDIVVWPQNGYKFNCSFFTTTSSRKPITNGTSEGCKNTFTDHIILPLDAETDIAAANLAIYALREISRNYLQELVELRTNVHTIDAWDDDGNVKLRQMIDTAAASHQPWFLTKHAYLTTGLTDDYETNARLVVETEYDGNKISFVSESKVKDFKLSELIDSLIELVTKLTKDTLINRLADEHVTDPKEQEYLDLLESCLVT